MHDWRTWPDMTRVSWGGDIVCPNTLAAGITAIAAAIAEGREADEITLIGATLTQLGDTLATIAAQKNFCGKQALGQKGD